MVWLLLSQYCPATTQKFRWKQSSMFKLGLRKQYIDWGFTSQNFQNLGFYYLGNHKLKSQDSRKTRRWRWTISYDFGKLNFVQTMTLELLTSILKYSNLQVRYLISILQFKYSANQTLKQTYSYRF